MTFGKRLESELTFSVSRSGGPGGQNVNKVNSKVTLKFDVGQSQLLTEEEKATITAKLASVLTKEGVLIVTSQDSRSQLDNKQTAIQKFEKMLSKAFEKRKKRVATKSTKSSVRKRLQNKKQHSEKKKWRQKL
jgi:ribosome-associated protein